MWKIAQVVSMILVFFGIGITNGFCEEKSKYSIGFRSRGEFRSPLIIDRLYWAGEGTFEYIQRDEQMLYGTFGVRFLPLENVSLTCALGAAARGNFYPMKLSYSLAGDMEAEVEFFEKQLILSGEMESFFFLY